MSSHLQSFGQASHAMDEFVGHWEEMKDATTQAIQPIKILDFEIFMSQKFLVISSFLLPPKT